MGSHKRTKFPLDISKENSKDMFRLKFIRKSEMEPTVRHHLKHAASQMDKQLDVWYKEQSFTIGTISKQQDKLSQTRKRLKKEQRKIKKQEYARHQEETRTKLQDLRLRMMQRKVVEKFKANVAKAHAYRNAELNKVKRSFIETANTTRQPDTLSAENDNNGTDRVMVGLKRFPSSVGKQMEPIPEEDIELEVDDSDTNEKPSTVHSKRRGHQLNRTRSTRTVLDIKATVPLLPDLYPRKYRQNVKSQSNDTNNATHCSPDTEHQPQSQEGQTEGPERKTKSIVVKLPIASRSPHARTPRAENLKTSRSDSLQSNTSITASVRGVHGSDTEVSDDDEDDTDASIASLADSLSEEAAWDNTSDYGSAYSAEEFIPDEISLTLTRYRRKGVRKITDSKKGEEAHPARQNFPDERILPELASLSDSKQKHIQNPYLAMYKERSFYIENKTKETLTDHTDAKLSTMDDLYMNTNKISKGKNNDGTDFLVTKESTSVIHNETSKDMTVFGRKADYNAKKQLKTPPNTPAARFITTNTSPRSPLGVGSINKKRAQSLDKHPANRSMDEPFQRYERTKTGQLIALGGPKAAHHFQFPSMKEQYKRDKLLKMERDSQFNHHMKMERFFNSFDHDKPDFPTPNGRPPSKLNPLPDRPQGDRGKSLTNFVFKVLGSEDEDSSLQKEIVPRAETTSVRLLKNCRYLREYKPLIKGDNLVYPIEKETSWEMNRSTIYSDKYMTNVRLKLC